MNATETQILNTANKLRLSPHTMVLSGAGLSVASGIPTYRCSVDGLWTHPDNAKFRHIDGVRQDPVGARAFWEERKQLMDSVRPNAAHYALKELQDLAEGGVDLITQNVDGLLHDAGCRDVLELHGSLRRLTCMNHPGFQTTDSALSCPDCSAGLRPAITLFGERVDSRAAEKTMSSAQRAHVLLVVGTSAEVYPAALAIPIAASQMASIIVIDPNPPLIEHPFVSEIRLPAEVALPAIVKAIKGGL